MENCTQNKDVVMSRKEFLKKSTLGLLAVALFGKVTLPTVEAATVSDNLQKNGSHIGPTAPANLDVTWIDTANEGVMKYWNGVAWVPIRSTWDE